MQKFNEQFYKDFCDEEIAAVNQLKSKIATIKTDCRVLVNNAACRRNEWKTVQSVEIFDSATALITTTDNKKFWANDVLIVHSTTETDTMLICLNDRQDEFREALSRAGKSNLEVFADFEFDSFVVVNRDNNHEYKVVLKSIHGNVLVCCEQNDGAPCKDFKYRGRICKHISFTLNDFLCSILAKFSKKADAEEIVAKV